MLCPECHELKQLREITPDGVVQLSCGHQRGETLPVRFGHVSVEQMRTAAGQQSFPGSTEGDETSRRPWTDWNEP
jgi:hypothetical protein